MAFEEIKAKLGLDITAFQQGAANAQGSLKTLTGEATKKFTDMKQVGQSVATALGVSYQAIADSVARFVIGFSKEQEKALDDLVSASDAAAAKQEAAREAAIKKNRSMAESLAEREERIRYEKLTDEQKLDELYKRRDSLTRRASSTKDGSTANLQARLDLLDTEEEIAKVKERQFQTTKAEYEKTLEIEQALEEGVADIVDMITDAQAEQAEQDKDRTEQLKKQREELEKQLRLKQAELRAARVQSVLPTTEDVTSGRRRIGSRAFKAATALEQERQNSLDLADRVQRDYETLAEAKGMIDRSKAEAALNASRAALAASQQRIQKGQEFLGARIKDVNPYATMEQELVNIRAELTTLNTQTLNPKATK